MPCVPKHAHAYNRKTFDMLEWITQKHCKANNRCQLHRELLIPLILYKYVRKKAIWYTQFLKLQRFLSYSPPTVSMPTNAYMAAIVSVWIHWRSWDEFKRRQWCWEMNYCNQGSIVFFCGLVWYTAPESNLAFLRFYCDVSTNGKHSRGVKENRHHSDRSVVIYSFYRLVLL